MEWIVFGVLIWLVFSRKGRTLFHGDGPRFRRRDQRSLEDGLSDGIPIQRSHTTEVGTRTQEPDVVAAPATPQPLSPARAREEEIQRLRRLYVADEITVEEYERRLDELMRGS